MRSLLLVSLALAAPASAGVIAHYRFETGPHAAAVTSIVDSGPNALNGTVGARTPALTYTNNTAPGGGNFALNATGDGSYGRVANNALLRPTGDFTLELFVRPDVPNTGSNADANLVVVMKNAELGDSIVSYGIGYNPGTTSFYTEIDTTPATFGAGSLYHGSGTLTPNAWHHIALVFDENGVNDVYSMYTNGVLTGTVTGNFPIYFNPSLLNPFVIGAGNFNGDSGQFRRNFGGFIDEVRLSDQALTPGQFIPAPGTAALLGLTGLLAARRRR